MKWVKIAIGFLIGLSVMPIIIKSLNNIQTNTVSFEILELDGDSATINDGTYDKIMNLIELEQAGEDYWEPTNVKSVKLNGQDMINEYDSLYLLNDSLLFGGAGPMDWAIYFDDDPNILHSKGYPVELGDVWTIEFEVNNSVNPTTFTLLTLIPLIFGASLLIYLNKEVSNREL